MVREVEEEYDMLDDPVIELEEGDAELEREFVKELNILEETMLNEIEQREKLLKVRMTRTWKDVQIE